MTLRSTFCIGQCSRALIIFHYESPTSYVTLHFVFGDTFIMNLAKWFGAVRRGDPAFELRSEKRRRGDAEICSRDGTTSNRCRTIITVVSVEGDKHGRYTIQMF